MHLLAAEHVVGDEFREFTPLDLRGAGVSVTREIDQIPCVVDPEVVDQSGLAGRSGDFCQALASGEEVDERRLPDVAPPDEGDVGEWVLRDLCNALRRAFEFGFRDLHRSAVFGKDSVCRGDCQISDRPGLPAAPKSGCSDRPGLPAAPESGCSDRPGLPAAPNPAGPAPLPVAGVFVVEAVAHAEHQEVRHVEIAQAVADVEERIVRHGHLQGQDLIERPQVAALVQDVDTQSDADVEVGHDELPAGRDAEGDLAVEARIDGLDLCDGAPVGDRIGGDDVGTAVVYAVERDAGPELVAEIVHRGEVEPHDRVGVRSGILLLPDLDSLASPRPEEDQIVADMALECGDEGPRFGLGGPPSEVVGESGPAADGVEPGVGILGVSVGEVGEGDAGREVHLAHDPPLEQEIDVEVGVDLRPHHYVAGVGVGVVGLPAERESEIPFVVEREPGCEPCDAGSLEEVDRHGIPDFVGALEVVVGDAEALVDASVDAVGGSNRAGTGTSSGNGPTGRGRWVVRSGLQSSAACLWGRCIRVGTPH